MAMNDKRRNKVGLGLWIGIGLLTALVVALILLPPRREPKPPREDKPALVRSLIVTPRAIADVLELTGRVEARADTVMGCEQEGRIVDLAVDRGARVKAGQVLLATDRRLWEAGVRRALIERDDAARDLRRWSELRAAGAVSPSEFEAAQSRLDRAEVALRETQTWLDQCEVRAPFDGLVAERLVEPGSFVNKGQAAFRIVRLDPVKIVFDLPERDILTARVGAPVTFGVTAAPAQTFTGRVAFVSPAAPPGGHAFRIELEADNAVGLLRPGMIADVHYVRGERATALVIPLAAVTPRKGETVVYVIEADRAVRRVVQIDGLRGAEAILAGGLTRGERLVIEGQRALQDGQPVIEADQQPAAQTPSSGDERRPEAAGPA